VHRRRRSRHISSRTRNSAAFYAANRARTTPQPPVINLQKDPALPPPVMRTDHVQTDSMRRLSLGLGSLGASMNVPHPVVLPTA